MERDLKNLKELFHDSFFRIPDYQRGYSWGEEQLKDFWEDLELLDDEKSHYTGMITIEKIKNPKDNKDGKLINKFYYSPYYLVDGQQRITTISILLKCIFDEFEENENLISKTKKDWEEIFLFKKIDGFDYYLFGYETDNPSNYYFKNKILENTTSDYQDNQETVYTNNLSIAKKFFKENIEKLNKDEIITLFKKVTNQLKFNLYEVDNDLEVFVTFETMNNRGKSLSKLELLKNRLIYLSTNILENDEVDAKELRKLINDTWKNIYNCLGKNKENILKDDDFLYNHWILYFKGYNRKESAVFSKFLLKEKFTIRNIKEGKLTGKDIKDYIENLKVSIESYFFIKNPNFESSLKNEYEKSLIYLIKLNRLGFASFLPLVISLFNKKLKDSEMEENLKKLENFIFCIYKLNRILSNWKSTDFFKYSYALKENEKSVEDIFKKLEKLKEDEFKPSYFKYYMKKNFEKKNGGFYNNWYGELKYVLFEYELSLTGENTDLKINWDDLNFKDNKTNITIEHIFPQSKSETKNEKIICQSLGNLVPLNKFINSSLGNKDFEEKKERYSCGSLSEIEISKMEKWSEKEIKERGLKILEFMEERWNFSFETYKLEILGFEKLN
jgi:uncharacterized protein with ParB-like and HNH nuclease domain